MKQKEPTIPDAIEADHFEVGHGETEAPIPPAENPSYHPSIETYTFSMPSAPVPQWVREMVARKQRSAHVARHNPSDQ